MTFDEFLKEVKKRENKNWAGMRWHFEPVGMMRLGHGICGICNEAGELMAHWKKAVFMGGGLASPEPEQRDLARVGILEELGDLMFFTTLVMDSIGVTLDEVYKANVAKLEKRYGEDFTTEKCEHRDVAAELREVAAVMEGKEGRAEGKEGRAEGKGERVEGVE